MPVRSKRLAGPQAVGTANSLLYTGPAGETTLLKQITLANTSPLANTIALKLNGTSGSQTIFFETVGGSQASHLDGLFVVLQPGDTLHGQAGAATMIVALFGAQLEGVAD
jgi:hypothetical protein